jgi:hypothetical protein
MSICQQYTNDTPLEIRVVAFEVLGATMPVGRQCPLRWQQHRTQLCARDETLTSTSGSPQLRQPTNCRKRVLRQFQLSCVV